MPRALGGEGDDLRQAAAIACLGDDPQPLREEQALGPPRLLVPEGSQAFDGGVGKSGDLASHLFLAEAILDQGDELLQRHLRMNAVGVDHDAVTHRGA